MSMDNISDIQKLRYRIFIEELGWLQPNDKHLDIDKYDQRSHLFAVFQGEKPIATARVTLRPGSFMIEDSFMFLVDKVNKLSKSKNTAEISRLAITRQYRGSEQSKLILSMLLKKIYQFLKINNIKFVYVVSISSFLDSCAVLLRANFHALGNEHADDKGVLYKAVQLNLDEIKKWSL